MTDLRITVRNTSEIGGTFLTPVYFGFHDGSFDLFDAGQAASPGLESLAEDGDPSALAAERAAAAPGSQGVVVAGAAGPIATQEVTTGTITVDGSINTQVSLAAMLLPSNDAFIGTDAAVTLFDEGGTFLGAQTLTFAGADVYDAGTEVNTELDAAFINQGAPDTGVDEGGVVGLHPGFNGSAGNPVGDGDQIILGGTNAFGAPIDAEAADFTLPGAQIAEIHINTVLETAGTTERDILKGGAEDDLIQADAGRDILFGGDGFDALGGGADRDLIFGGAGDDELSGDGGNDRIDGGAGRDVISGGEGRDLLRGGDDADVIDGGAGRDLVLGGDGNDILAGGDERDLVFGGNGDDVIVIDAGNDRAFGGTGSDTFLFATATGRNQIRDFEIGTDLLAFTGTSLGDFDAVLDAARGFSNGTRIDLGDGDVFLSGVDLGDLTADDFLF